MAGPNRMSKAIAKYCDRYAEPEIAQLRGFPPSPRFRHAIVVPAYRESGDFIARLQRLATQVSHTLVIVVINQPQQDRDTISSAALFDTVWDSGDLHWQSEQLTLLDWENNCAMMAVNRFSEGHRIPDKQGVGLARKIGCDLALALKEQDVLSARFIHSTDADAYLPEDYFSRTANVGEVSAAIYPFRHCCDASPVGQATAIYEQSLHYYVAGLAWAGSPYAFHTIGSCLALSMSHYAQVRGFPKRSGGEDFYLLNKLAKLAKPTQLQGTPIRLEARSSSRVPFGTGPAVSKIMALDSLADFTSYHPQVFRDLGHLLRRFTSLWQCRYELATWLSYLPDRIQCALHALGLESLVRHLQDQVTSEAASGKHIDHWFDAFRTLKFIHYLQANCFPELPFSEALPQASDILDNPTCRGNLSILDRVQTKAILRSPALLKRGKRL